MTHSLHRKEDIDRVRETLETLKLYPDASVYPDGPCIYKHDKDDVREALDILNAGKDVEVVGNAHSGPSATGGFQCVIHDFDVFEDGSTPLYAITEKAA